MRSLLFNLISLRRKWKWIKKIFSKVHQ